MCFSPSASCFGCCSLTTATARLAMFLPRSPMRSSSFEMRSAAMICRRSYARGCRRAIITTACSSISFSNVSIASSSLMVAAASSGSRRSSASKDWPSTCSVRPPILAILLLRRESSSSYDLTMCSCCCSIRSVSSRASLAEAAGDVVLRALLLGVGKNLGRFVELDKLTEIHEGGEVGSTRCLLHVMGNDGNGVVAFQDVDQFLDLGGRDRVERRARLVEENDLRPDGDGSSDAKSLLLAPR